MGKKKSKHYSRLENISIRITEWMGTPWSIVIHTLFFLASFTLVLFGIKTDTVMLILTTIVSLEAIYLSLFIQMTVNRNTQSLEEVEEDIEEIQEDVDSIDEIHASVAEISEDVNELTEADAQEQKDEEVIENLNIMLSAMEKQLTDIRGSLTTLGHEITNIKAEKKFHR